MGLVYLQRTAAIIIASSFVDILFIFVFCYLGNGTSSISLKDCETHNLVFLTVEFS